MRVTGGFSLLEQSGLGSGHGGPATLSRVSAVTGKCRTPRQHKGGTDSLDSVIKTDFLEEAASRLRPEFHHGQRHWEHV